MSLLKKITNVTALFESNMSASEWTWRIFTLMGIMGSGGLGAWVSLGTPYISPYLPMAYVFIALIVAIFVSIIFWLVKSAALKQAQAQYTMLLASRPASITPLSDSFCDQIINVSDLSVPGEPRHDRKLFRRCKLVGPGGMVILGGNLINCIFNSCADVIPLPDGTNISGLTLFNQCTFDNCEFVQIALLVNQPMAQTLKEQGFLVAGMKK